MVNTALDRLHDDEISNRVFETVYFESEGEVVCPTCGYSGSLKFLNRAPEGRYQGYKTFPCNAYYAQKFNNAHAARSRVVEVGNGDRKVVGAEVSTSCTACQTEHFQELYTFFKRGEVGGGTLGIEFTVYDRSKKK